MSDLADGIAQKHYLNPHDFGCACGEWTYRADAVSRRSGIDFEGHLVHVAEVTEAQVRAQVAAEIEAERDRDRAEAEPGPCEFADEGDCHNDGRYTGFSLAARIVRGESS